MTHNRDIPRLSPPGACLCSTADEVPCDYCLEAYARYLDEQEAITPSPKPPEQP